MKRPFAGSAVALSLLASAAWAQSPPLSDAAYVTKASVGDAFEVQESRLALERATDKRIKDFAKAMIDDHAAADTALRDAAGKAGAKVETALDAPHQAMLDNLKTFNGTDFDKVYTADQVRSHAATVALLSDYKQNGKNADLKSWTDAALPKVKDHQAAINAM